MKRFVFSVSATIAVAAAATAVALAQPSLTGSWTIQQTGLNGSTTAVVKVQQSGDSFTGTSENGTGFTGTFVSESKINGKWHGPGGAGWLTIYATPNGHSLNGTWGYNGRPANGSFTGNKFLPPSPITAAGTWNVTAAGGSDAAVGKMVCTQSGPSTLCKVGPIVINGKFRTKDKVRATWTNTATKKSGWFSFWFNGDNNSFNGTYGLGADTTPAVGRVVGQRALSG